MNQKVIAGIGNIYANEILFLAKVHPLKKVKLIDFQTMKRLVYYIKYVLKEAIKNGSKKLLVIRTRPSDVRLEQGYISWFAEYWNYDNEALSNLFHNSYKTYNDRVDFLNGDKPEGVDWHVLAPPHDLRSDGYYLYKEDVDADYRLGLEVGLDFLHQLKNS